VNLLQAGTTEPPELERQLLALFELCVGLGGAISASMHRPGQAGRLHPVRRSLPAGGTQGVKRALDPEGIFNPGKVL